MGSRLTRCLTLLRVPSPSTMTIFSMGAVCGGGSTGRAPSRLVKRRQLRNTEPPGVRIIAPPNHKVPLPGGDAPAEENVSRLSRFGVNSPAVDTTAHNSQVRLRREARLFVAQRFYWVYAHCAAGGDQTSESGGEGQDQGDGDEGGGIGGGNVDQQGFQNPGDGERGGESEHESDGELGHALGKDEAEDVSVAGAEGDANADFLGSLIDGVGDDGVEADRGQAERDGGEDGEQDSEHAVGPVLTLQLFVHGAEVADGEAVVEGLD